MVGNYGADKVVRQEALDRALLNQGDVNSLDDKTSLYCIYGDYESCQLIPNLLLIYKNTLYSLWQVLINLTFTGKNKIFNCVVGVGKIIAKIMN